MKESDQTIRELRTLKTILEVMSGKLSKQARPPNDTPEMKRALNCIYNASVFADKALNHILRESKN